VAVHAPLARLAGVAHRHITLMPRKLVEFAPLLLSEVGKQTVADWDGLEQRAATSFLTGWNVGLLQPG